MVLMRRGLRGTLALSSLATALAALGPSGGCSCGDGLPPAGDGGATPRDGAAPGGDAGVATDAAQPLLWVNFSITGCDPADGGGDIDAGPGPAPSDAGPTAAICRGPAPLHLSFAPVSPAPIDVYQWRFGDGSAPDGRASPDHVFDAPGTYDVALSAQGPGGTAGITRAGIVVVGPGALGGACSDASQCASGDCVCGAGSGGCAGVAAGFCSAACSAATACADGAVCANLSAAAGGSPPDAWQTRLCLPDCSGGAPCPAGLTCRELLRGDAGGWVSACFAPGLVGDIGDSCTAPDGSLDDAACTSGSCLPLGLRGVCSAPCSAGECPASAACAVFAGGSPAPSCLARCGPGTSCSGDPLLACEPAGGTGALSFTVDEPPAEAGYCAPRPCAAPDDCGPLGQCQAGYCAPR